MILATDVQYDDDKALAAGVLFDDWQSDNIIETVLKPIDNIEPYEPGAFYRRELPCLMALLDALEKPLDAIIVDGFVTLGSEAQDGLGMHLYHAIDKSIPVIGVAKRAFADTPQKCEVYRGQSEKPLYVTSVGIELEEAKSSVANMHGENRLPTLLKRVDQLCRGIEA